MTAFELREIKAIIERKFTTIEIEIRKLRANDYAAVRKSFLAKTKKDFDALEKRRKELDAEFVALGYEPVAARYNSHNEIQSACLKIASVDNAVVINWASKLALVETARQDFLDDLIVLVVDGLDVRAIIDRLPTTHDFLK